tara:strand:+ start:309 stop:590 length:282 start_codon:yes stop_codon:yes gene_type:complete
MNINDVRRNLQAKQVLDLRRTLIMALTLINHPSILEKVESELDPALVKDAYNHAYFSRPEASDIEAAAGAKMLIQIAREEITELSNIMDKEDR